MLLEEQLAGNALRRADERYWPVLEVREHPRRDAVVVRDQFQLGDARTLVNDTVAVGDRDIHRRGRCLGRRRSLRLLAREPRAHPTI